MRDERTRNAERELRILPTLDLRDVSFELIKCEPRDRVDHSRWQRMACWMDDTLDEAGGDAAVEEGAVAGMPRHPRAQIPHCCRCKVGLVRLSSTFSNKYIWMKYDAFVKNKGEIRPQRFSFFHNFDLNLQIVRIRKEIIHPRTYLFDSFRFIL